MAMKMLYTASQMNIRLTQIGERAERGVSAKMRRIAMAIRDLAKEYAPRDTGTLESGIEYMQIREGRRNAYIVFVNDKVMNSKSGKALGEYALIMENQLRPYTAGKYKLGRLSAEKRASGKKVGGLFLDRARKDGARQILGATSRTLRRAFED